MACRPLAGAQPPRGSPAPPPPGDPHPPSESNETENGVYGDIVLRVQTGDTIQFRDQNHHPYMKLSSGVALDTRLSLSWESWDAADAWWERARGEFDDARRLAVERWERAHPVEAEMRRVDEARYDRDSGLGAPWGGDAA